MDEPGPETARAADDDGIVGSAKLPGDITPKGAPAAAGEQPAESDGGEPKGSLSFLRELPVLILIAFALAMLIKTFFLQAFYIPSESMVPTLEVRDRVLVNKLVYRFRDPRRGEIVVFVGERDDTARSFLQKVRDQITEGFGAPSSSERDFIKRVIALPGETIEVDDSRVTVTTTDGRRLVLDEPYLAERLADSESSFGPFTVPPDSYFVMGDNRDNSQDSRSTLGTIHRSDIIGKAFVRIWPVKRFSFFRRPSYENAERGAEHPTVRSPAASPAA